MQAVVAVPPSPVLSNYADGAGVLERPVAGVPLLTRVIATAGRAGADSVLLIWPRDVDESIWQRVLESPLLKSMRISRLVEAFDPAEADNWAAIELALEDRFLWLPWNWVTHKRALAGLAAQPAHPALWEAPVVLDRHVAASRNGAQLAEQAVEQAVEGVALLPHTETAEAERFVVAHSGKPSDGIYSRFNRWLCRPAVRFLSHTRVTPNWITLGGLLLAIPAALLYARGFYAAYVGGALLFFLSGLFDEMDGMLARIEFRESVFGTWFEGLVDEGTYLLLFWGITAGLYRQRGPRELIYPKTGDSEIG
ncbi:MAG: CDP-alcohol phosphatidyltransferase family protein [Bryobacteraceae bacterium]